MLGLSSMAFPVSCFPSRSLNFAQRANITASSIHLQVRAVSSSPYGRTHVWKRRQKKLPNPMVPVFPQRLVRVDGSTIVHWTTSPRSVIRLTRDTTNNPLWNAARFVGMDEEEDEVTGRMGRFSRRFADLGGQKSDLDWLDEASGTEGYSSSTGGTAKGKAK
ncbi:hypothetical protein BD309DRAFT_932828 [Dichomitus squalens]|uniref:Uncharacterized protein n=1 Tax=Dichomitus squalens TaxID=114155 RepID=A0A4Q9PCT0_9APHY|nr:hypothetical protein BD309DRAFT_932828 [Dichomitus squalens]TBU52634.1 hypothetical protein BD310DRAFT_970712 [Dichomitus squalens]